MRTMEKMMKAKEYIDLLLIFMEVLWWIMHMRISDAPKEETDALSIWQGVSEEDIANETPRFIAYAYTLRDMGKI